MPEPRIAPVAPPYSAPVAAALERIMPPGVPPLGLFRTLAANRVPRERTRGAARALRGAISRVLIARGRRLHCGLRRQWRPRRSR